MRDMIQSLQDQALGLVIGRKGVDEEMNGPFEVSSYMTQDEIDLPSLFLDVIDMLCFPMSTRMRVDKPSYCGVCDGMFIQRGCGGIDEKCKGGCQEMR